MIAERSSSRLYPDRVIAQPRWVFHHPIRPGSAASAPKTASAQGGYSIPRGGQKARRFAPPGFRRARRPANGSTPVEYAQLGPHEPLEAVPDG